MIRGEPFLEQAQAMFRKTGLTQMRFGIMFGFFGLLVVFNLFVFLVSREITFLFGTGVMAGFLLFENFSFRCRIPVYLV
jgi:hypothetical protein